MENISYFNACEAQRGLLGNIKKAKVFLYPVQA